LNINGLIECWQFITSVILFCHRQKKTQPIMRLSFHF
jgi:hypothetical protein